MMPLPPPRFPIPPNLDAMQPHQRNRAMKIYDQELEEFFSEQRQWSKDRAQEAAWFMAVVIVVALSMVATLVAMGIHFNGFYETLRLCLFAFVGLGALFLVTYEIKKRLESSIGKD